MEGKSQFHKTVLISTCTLTHIPTHKLLTHTLIINFKLRMNHSYGLFLHLFFGRETEREGEREVRERIKRERGRKGGKEGGRENANI